MEVRPGYRQTEVGVIPEDWEVTTVTGLACPRRNAIVGGPFGSDLVSKDYVMDGIPVIRGQNMARKYVSGDFVFVSQQKAESLDANLAHPGDVVFTQRGTLGQVSLVPDLPHDSYLISQSQMKLTLDPRLADSEYVYYVFISPEQQRTIGKCTIQTGLPHINLGILKAMAICRPTISEQQAIAEALSDADALIESLEKLIAKKRLIKQGAMQELLTGKRRLPGLSGEWEVKRLGELFRFGGGHSASRAQLSSEGYCYLHYGDIHTSNKYYVDVESEFQKIPKLNVPLSELAVGALLADGDVVFVDASEDTAGTSKYVVVENVGNIVFIAGLHTIVAKSREDNLDKKYLRYCFQAEKVRTQFVLYAVGTKVLGINKKSIANIEVLIPALGEQAAIGALFSDMDAEIEALEAKLAKARQIKQGMMQELLTGRIRLV